ncbi:MAG: 3'-5' exonuclease, partial [Candidatus Levybacteria bacterium]|nr:3'-5' exonuclease [Candidatus Levybacteria bacterium]
DPDQSIYSFKFAHPQGMDDYSTSQSGVESYTIPFTARSAKKIVYFANQLLSQQDPTRIDLLQPITTQIDGEVKFVKKYSQPEEFDTVIESVRELIVNGESPSNIMILAPRRGLAKKFIEHSEEREPENVKFQFVSKIEFSLNEQERILLLSLIANPNSILHKRSYIGMTDPTHFSKEINKLKSVYGSLEEVLAQAKKEDCRPVEKRKQQVCERITFLREFLLAHNSEQGLAVVLEELFPIDNEELKSMNSLLQDLTEEGDSVKTVYAKFVDYVRALPETDSIVRVMTPLSSKGLEANHVFIIGCNQGNIPGTRTLEHITDHEHVQEQRRILYVTFTRAIKTLTVSWSRYIPFEQALGHNTARVSSVPRRINGVLMSEVGICEFLEDLNGAVWIT